MAYKPEEWPRRDFLRMGVKAAGGAVLAGSAIGRALANNHPHVHENSLDYLDRATYIRDMEVHTVFEPELRGQSGIQIFARGNNRYIFTDRDVLDVTDPLHPAVINENAWEGGRPSLAYNRNLRKWIFITGAGAPGTFANETQQAGKYTYPSKIVEPLTFKGLRGVRVYDATDPMDIKLLSKLSSDQGDPDREVQTGEGVARSYYDGGKYAYLDCGPDNSFTRMESPYRHYTRCLQIIDVEDPANPRFVSNWWVPGQREGEDEEYAQWPEHWDRVSWTSSNGYPYVPRRVEDGGRYCYSTWGSFGFMIHDVSDPAHPTLVSQFRGDRIPGSIEFYNCNLSWLDRGIAIAHSETLELDCGAPLLLPWVLDVSDPANPRPLSRLPRPTPPAEAPYDDFCNLRGRFGMRNSPQLIAPGRVDRNFFPISYFTGGLQCYDLTDPTNPQNVAYFLPPQGGDLEVFRSFNRPVQNVYVEWDRRLMWVGTNTGLYLLSSPHLGEPVLEPMPVTEWTVPGVNVGHG